MDPSIGLGSTFVPSRLYKVSSFVLAIKVFFSICPVSLK